MPESSVQPLHYMSIPESLANLGSNLKKARDQFSDGKYEEAIDILN